MQLFIGLIFTAFVSASAQQFAARVEVQSPEDVIRLYRDGATLDDAKIRTRVSADGSAGHIAVYNPENGYVTVTGAREDLDDLVQRGYRLSGLVTLDGRQSAPSSVARGDTIPYQFGWPRTIFNGMSLYENSPTVADMNRNGQLEVSVTNAWGSFNPTVPPYLIVWRSQGTYLSGFPVALEPGVLQSSADGGISAAGDIAGDDRLEIVCGDENGYLYAFAHNGTSLPGFPRHYGFSVGVFPPALADFDGDGKLDIVFISHNWSSPYGNAQLHLLKVTPSGPAEFPGFPVALEMGARNSPAVGDLNGDGRLEIVVGTGGSSGSGILSKVIAFNDSGRAMPGFPWVVGTSSVGNTPTLYDITGDGNLEILIRVRPDATMVNGIYALDHTGAVLSGFPFPISPGHPGACVAVGDMDGDGIPELAYGGVEAIDLGKVWVYNLEGQLLPGFPAAVMRTWVDGSVAIADVDGDGLGDVVCGTNGVSNNPGLIRAFNRFGREVSGFPLSPGNPILNSFETHPTLVDIDRDGDTEIFAGRLDRNVYGWDTPGLFDAGRAWTMFKGNPARTGGQVRSPAVSVREQRATIADAFDLRPNFPNPFNPSTTFEFALPKASRVSLTVYNMLGREVDVVMNQTFASGVHRVTWNAERIASGVYQARMEVEGSVRVRKVVLLR